MSKNAMACSLLPMICHDLFTFVSIIEFTICAVDTNILQRMGGLPDDVSEGPIT